MKLLACGRRWGKTCTGMLAAIRGHGPHRGCRRGAIDGARIWWVAPSYPQIEASNIWNDLKKACTKEAGCTHSEQSRTIGFPGGGSIEVKSADSDLRGAGLDGMVDDEVAFMEEDTWTKVLRPMLADKKGWCIHITTPNGMNWWRDLFLKAKNRPGWETWQRPSSDNPLMTPEELSELEWSIGPQAFSQEHGAQFTDIEGAGFPGSYFDGDDLFFDDWPDDGEIVWRALGIDPSLGRTEHGDYSAIVSMALNKHGIIYVDADLARRPPATIIADCIGIVREFRPHAVGIETNGFQEMIVPQLVADAAKVDCPLPPIECIVNSSNTSKVARIITSLDPYLALKRREFRFRKTRGCGLLVKQLREFPSGEHDDGPDAMDMCLVTLKKLFSGEIAA